MLQKPSATPRKLPKQERSQATVEAILTATTHILTEEGYNKLTTNRVAELAGVSIGSLYQYFPNKEARSIQCHLQSVVTIWEKYRDLYEMEQWFLDHLHDETACAIPSDEPPQTQDFLRCEQPLGASKQEYCS